MDSPYLDALNLLFSVSVLTICNHKGGTGKTTTSIHLAAALGQMGARVLVIDFDPQGFLTHALELDEPLPSRSSLALLRRDTALGGVPAQRASGFSVIGATPAMTKAARKLTNPADVLWLRETLRKGYPYDVILIDTAAALSVYAMNALATADGVLIPVTPEYQPVVGGEQTWHTAKLVRKKLNPDLNGPLILLTQVDGRLNRHAEYSSYMREQYGDAVMRTTIRTSSALADSCSKGKTVFDTNPNVRGALDYVAAAEEVADKWFVEAGWFKSSGRSIGDADDGSSLVPALTTPLPTITT